MRAKILLEVKNSLESKINLKEKHILLFLFRFFRQSVFQDDKILARNKNN